jgi:hypothetical protein
MAILNPSLPGHMEALELELLAALNEEPQEMSQEDWDRLRAWWRQEGIEKRWSATSHGLFGSEALG